MESDNTIIELAHRGRIKRIQFVYRPSRCVVNQKQPVTVPSNTAKCYWSTTTCSGVKRPSSGQHYTKLFIKVQYSAIPHHAAITWHSKMSIYASYLSQYLTNLMHKICFTINFISCLYMFRAHVLIIRRSKLHYTASGIITPIGQQNVKKYSS